MPHEAPKSEARAAWQPHPAGRPETARDGDGEPAGGPRPAGEVRCPSGDPPVNGPAALDPVTRSERSPGNSIRGELPRLRAAGNGSQDYLSHVLAAQAEASIDGILIVDGQGETVFANRRFFELWDFPGATGPTGPDATLLQMALEKVADPAMFLAKVEHLYRHPGETSRDEVALKDGRVFDRYSASILDPDGGRAGRVWFFHDITRRARAEARLLESRQSLEAILNSIADPVFVKDSEHRFTVVNEAFCAMIGSPREAILGRRDADFFPPEQVNVFLRQDDLVFATGIPDVNEEELTRADGAIRTIVTKKTLHTDFAGQAFIVGVIRDTTEQVQAKEALQASEERFEQVAEAAGEWIWEVDAKGLYTYCSRGVEAILGYAPEDLVGKRHFYDLFAPDVREELKCAALDAFSRGLPFRGFPNPNVRRDGTIALLETSGTPALDAGGNVLGYRGADTDITARREAEERISSLVAAVEQSADDSIVIDLERRIQYVNSAFERTTGYSSEEVVGLDVDAFLCRGPDESAIPEIWTSIRQGQPWKGRFGNRTKDGRAILLDGSISAIRDVSGVIIGYVSTRRDVTKQVEIEAHLAQADKLEAIGTLAGGIAHDFNNILCLIVGGTQVALRECGDDSPVKRDLEVVLQGARRATDLVRQILRFSRNTLREENVFEVGPIVKEASKFLRATVPTTIEIRTDVRSTSRIVADPTEIHRTIINLSMNAILAMNERAGLLEIGLVDVEVDARFAQRFPRVTPGRFARLRVRDSGVGMSREVLNHIFEPFFTTREPGKGTGMGLAVVHGIVTSLRGAIDVASEPGKGTTFDIYLPVTGIAVPDAVAEEEIRPGTERVLVVDDDPLVLESIVDMLSELGYQARSETSGAAAQAAFEADPRAFDLVITDMTMPGMTGDVLAERLKACRPDIPIILCSGYTQEQMPGGIRVQGIDEYLMKPVFMDRLSQLMRKTLDGSCRRPVPSEGNGAPSPDLPATPAA
jgi:PAS domain S-box-containing protein